MQPPNTRISVLIAGRRYLAWVSPAELEELRNYWGALEWAYSDWPMDEEWREIGSEKLFALMLDNNIQRETTLPDNGPAHRQ